MLVDGKVLTLLASSRLLERSAKERARGRKRKRKRKRRFRPLALSFARLSRSLGQAITLHFALFIIICLNYGQVLTYIRTNYFPCRCTCANCSRDLLANISECYCCKELEGNWEALTSDIVLAELQEGHALNCDNNSFSLVL